MFLVEGILQPEHVTYAGSEFCQMHNVEAVLPIVIESWIGWAPLRDELIHIPQSAIRINSRRRF